MESYQENEPEKTGVNMTEIRNYQSNDVANLAILPSDRLEQG